MGELDENIGSWRDDPDAKRYQASLTADQARAGETIGGAARETRSDAQGFRLTFNWRALGSFRVLGAAILAALILAMPVAVVAVLVGADGLLVDILIWAAAVIGFLGVLLSATFTDALVLYCPACRKRVKMGADTCHHCGRAVADRAEAV